MEQSKEKKVYERTIAPELFEAWKTLRRKNDPQLICDEYGFSRPVIDRALNFGYVKTPQVKDKINQFFKRRNEAERDEAKELSGEK